MDDSDDNHPSSDDDHSSDAEYNPSDDSLLLLDKIYFSDNVFEDYFYEDMEYATDDEQAPYRNTRSHQNAATSAGAPSHESPDPAPEKRSHGRLSSVDKIPNKRRQTGGHLPPKKPKNDKGEGKSTGKGKPNSTSPGPRLPPDVPTASPATPDPVVQPVITPVMPDFQVPEESTSWEREMIGMYVHAIYLSLQC